MTEKFYDGKDKLKEIIMEEIKINILSYNKETSDLTYRLEGEETVRNYSTIGIYTVDYLIKCIADNIRWEKERSMRNEMFSDMVGKSFKS